MRWPSFKFPPINLWSFPRQRRDMAAEDWLLGHEPDEEYYYGGEYEPDPHERICTICGHIFMADHATSCEKCGKWTMRYDPTLDVREAYEKFKMRK